MFDRSPIKPRSPLLSLSSICNARMCFATVCCSPFCHSTVFLISYSLQVHAQQDSSGVYLTSDDFQNKKLTYAINCKTQKHKIKLKSFFSRPHIVVVHNDTAYTWAKNEIYGYKACGGTSYRFVDEKVYQILNPYEPIVLYRYFVYIPRDPTVEYFFSRDNGDEVHELTKANLKSVFPSNHRFHEALESLFERDFDLASYNKKTKEFRLLKVYKESLK